MLHGIFEANNKFTRDREKFLSRVFGIFSEKVVSIWTENELCPYRDLGRPTIKSKIGNGRHTLDFTLQDRVTEKIYVCEMKCEIEYSNFKHFILTDASHLNHHRKDAFEVFLNVAKQTGNQSTFIGNGEINPHGAILIWGSVTSEGRDHVVREKGLHDVLSIEDICSDLVDWKCVKYLDFIEHRRAWCNWLFDGLLGKNGEGCRRVDAKSSAPISISKHAAPPKSINEGGKNRVHNRTDEQERVLREMADSLGWPTRKDFRAAMGISGTENRYGECHFAWVVMETFLQDNGREPAPHERNALSEEHGLSPGNLRAEFTSWRKARRRSYPPKP